MYPVGYFNLLEPGVSTCYMLHMLYLSDDSNLLNSFDNSFMAVGCRPILARTGSIGELADDAL